MQSTSFITVLILIYKSLESLSSDKFPNKSIAWAIFGRKFVLVVQIALKVKKFIWA